MIDINRNYVDSPSVTKQCREPWKIISSLFKEGKSEQNERIDRFWNIYNCILSDQQSYVGTSHSYVPAIRDAIEARVKRFQSMLFPRMGNQITVVSYAGDSPDATMSVLENHIRTSHLDSLTPAMLRAGDVEGQWSLEVDWRKSVVTARRVRELVSEDGPTVSLEDEDIVSEGPRVEIVSAQDLAVYPDTVDNIQDAEIVSRRIWLTSGAMDRYVLDGWFDGKARELAVKSTSLGPSQKRSEDAGQREQGFDPAQRYLVYKIWTKIRFPGEKTSRPAVIFMTDGKNVLGVHANQFWSQRVPIISAPVEKIGGSFWGRSKVQHVEPLQYQLNDIINMSNDSAGFSVMPIVFTDPVKNPRIASMVLGMGAIWETSPADTQFATMPALWQQGFEVAMSLKSQIMESMDVNESMLGVAPKGRKNAQAIAAESQAAMASIVDTVRHCEQTIMTPLIQWFYELDQQFRDSDLAVFTSGRIGIEAKMEKIPPFELYQQYWFRWNGAEQMMGAQKVQQMIAFMNVARGVPPAVLNGKQLDIGPILDHIAEFSLGPTMKGQVLVDLRDQVSIDPRTEDEIMSNGLPLAVHPLDNDAEHIQVHTHAASETGDPHGTIRAHIMLHVRQLHAKAPPQGTPGIPGGAFAGPQPGVAGTPRAGAVPGQIRGVQNPPGAVHPDHLLDTTDPRG